MTSSHSQGLRTAALCAFLLAAFPVAQALTLNVKPVKLSTAQRDSLKRFIAESAPQLNVAWDTLEATSNSIGRERQPLTVSLGTVPSLTAAGICRSEKHSFYRESGSTRWRANDGLTRFHAWRPQRGDCATAQAPIAINKSLTDNEFAFLERQQEALRGRAAGVIGGSDCARVRYCEVTLRQIERQRQETPPRILTKLTYFPAKPGPSCLYVMEVSFVGSLEDLVPLGASCPKP
jgi:hypothetical protein